MNVWSNPSSASPAEINSMAAFLEERSRFPDQVQVNTRLREVLAPLPGERLLEVGSGSGVLCRQLVPYIQPDGRIIGLDRSSILAGCARRLAIEAGLSQYLRFDAGLAEELPYPVGSFDGVFAARLLLHSSDPLKIVLEMARVLRPGGRVVVMDWDFGTTAVDHSDKELTRRILQWRTDHHGGNNWSGRQLLRNMATAGLVEVSVAGVVTVVRDENAALTHSLWRAAEVARDTGAISQSEQHAWVAELKERIAAGHFLASIVYFIVRGHVHG
jgi:ubiquinone/menaquinone biosynthesis C-methylase UbiE